MMSEKKLYDLTLVPAEDCRLPALPKGIQLSRLLPGCICSDLFVAGFSRKRLDLGTGLIVDDDHSYRLLKRIKSAKYIRNDLLQRSAQQLLTMLKENSLQLQEGYIGYTQEVSLAIGPAPLPQSDKLFGVELRADRSFHCYALTQSAVFPDSILLEDVPFAITQMQPIHRDATAPGVLQSDLPIAADYRVATDSPSRFKLSYDPESRRTMLCAGSLICPPDYFGDGSIL